MKKTDQPKCQGTVYSPGRSWGASAVKCTRSAGPSGYCAQHAPKVADAPLNQDPRIRRSARLLALLGPIVWSAEAWAKRPRSRSEQSTPGVP